MIAARLAQFQTLLQARDKVRAGREAANQIAPVRTTLAEIAGTLTILSPGSGYSASTASSPPRHRKRPHSCGTPPILRERLAGPPNEVTGGQKQTYRRFKESAEKLRDILAKLTSDAWKDWVADLAALRWPTTTCDWWSNSAGTGNYWPASGHSATSAVPLPPRRRTRKKLTPPTTDCSPSSSRRWPNCPTSPPTPRSERSFGP